MTLPVPMLARLLGIPGAKEIAADALNRLARAELRKRFDAASADAAARSAKRRSRKEQVRSVEYHLWKSIVRQGIVADAIRDAHDDAVLAIVLPQVTDTTTIEQLAGLVVEAELEVTF